ncbi:prolactin regulatory element-binding protein [Cryptococcus deuterogattii 99/473]|nr:prolactin regulatory element-binding protein [Cryptococcus deuterogattii LA55]KIR75168.1 prolactin regulatory element-binding protein [Cryptococcus deuterogattii CA1014]KIR92837.1 prolactin regulatory element-binding protein [Cryptococcus deuterogattii CBS 10090]KIR98159.1 prolactin regulatory element-binding protein [Cryptococcus deuterogattii 2001/935-1]KIY60322.1 prolactin regulatory element-binding protein [Cryptococcus deuterogattii 99/473]
MTRTAHHPHPTPSFPVYCLDWADDAKLVLGGGGGATRSGIQNKLKLCKVSKDGRDLSYLTELALSNDEDAPMTMAIDKETKSIVTGINASSSAVQAGNNDHCRVYSFSDNGIELVRGRRTIEADWSDDYPYQVGPSKILAAVNHTERRIQKFTVLSPSYKLLAVGSTDDRVSILHFPSLEPAVPAFSTDSELVDLDWGGPEGEWLTVATTRALLLYQHSSGGTALTLRQTIYPPSFDIVPATFRSARFSRNPSTSLNIHAVLNSTKSAKRGAGRKAWVCTFGVVAGPSQAKLTEEEKATAKSEEEKGKEMETASDPQEDVGKWDVLIKREVAGKPVTVFDVSSDGRLLSYGCSDLSIGILDSKTLAPLLKILHAHSFPPTALKFNPSASLLVSASADNTVRAIVVPANFGGRK